MKNTNKVSALLLLQFALASVHANAADESIEGVWVTENGDGLIEFRVKDGLPTGFIAGSISDPEHAEPAEYDVHNPDPALREQPILGLAILTGMKDVRSKKWAGSKWKGRVYDPRSGKTYKCTLTLVDTDTLRIRGYLGIPFLGRTQVWTRFRASH